MSDTPDAPPKRRPWELTQEEIDAAIQAGDIDTLLRQVRGFLVNMNMSNTPTVMPQVFEAVLRSPSLTQLIDWTVRRILANDIAFLLRAQIRLNAMMPEADDRTQVHASYPVYVREAIERVQRAEDRVIDLLERVARIMKIFGQVDGNVARTVPDAVPVLNIADMMAEARQEIERERNAAAAV